MDWVLFALIYSFALAIVGHLDRFIISKYFTGGSGPGALILFSGLIGLPVVLVLLPFDLSVFQLGFIPILAAIFSGFLYLTGLIPYFHALEHNETSLVLTLFQLIPIISLFLGFIFLGEILSLNEIFASTLVLLSAIFLSLELNLIKIEKRVRFKLRPFVLMFISSSLFAFNILVFKMVALELTFWQTIFWQYFGFFIFSVFVFGLIPAYRRQFISVIKNNSFGSIGLNSMNELIAVGGQFSLHFATLLAPLAIVSVVADGFPPTFALIIGIAITVIFPNTKLENLDVKILTQKILAIFFMFVGIFILSLN